MRSTPTRPTAPPGFPDARLIPASPALEPRLTRSREWVVPPVHQRIPPAAVGDVAVGPLSEVAVDVADHLAHVPVVVVGELVDVPALQVHDPPSGRVPGRLGIGVTLLRRVTDPSRLVGVEPLLELGGRHVDHLTELLADRHSLVVGELAHCSSTVGSDALVGTPPPVTVWSRSSWR